jgi:hypothetical protein
MVKIIEHDLKNKIWDKIDKDFEFNPSINLDVIPFKFKIKVQCYTLDSFWTLKQEHLVNEIFKEISNEEIYALDWQHESFIFNPHEYRNFAREWYDESRDVNVYFPSYYPNGDYYFFIAKDFSYGLLGHPWRDEIYVFGDRLMELFESNKDALNITKKDL